MKPYLIYGFTIALLNALLTLALYLLGFYSDPDRLTAASYIGGFGFLIIVVVVTVLGMRAQRETVPVAEEFGYGRALGAGVMITLIAALLGALFYYAYLAFINPGFLDLLQQAQAAKLEAKGMSSDKIEQFQNISRAMMKPAVQAIFGFIWGMLVGTVISLVAAAFVKRSASASAPAA